MTTRTTDSDWFKSSYSNGGNNTCVECRIIAGQRVGVRDSKNPHGDAIWFAPVAWRTFLTATTESA